MCGGDADYVEETEYERQLVEMADKQLAHYNELYVPLEYQQMADVNRYRSDVFKQGSMDKAVNAARMQLPTSTGVAAGMDPGTGNVMLQSMAKEQQAGSAGAMGSMAGLQTAEDLYAQGAVNLAATGQKQQATNLNLASTMAQQQAGVVAAQKAADQTVRNAQMGLAGTVAGLGAGYAYNKGWLSGKPKKLDPKLGNNDLGVFQDTSFDF